MQKNEKSRVLVTSNKTGNEGHTAQNIADWADVKAGIISDACRVVQHWNTVALHVRLPDFPVELTGFLTKKLQSDIWTLKC